MFKYLLRRLVLVLPTLLLISVIVFLLGQSKTDDPFTARSGAVYAGRSKDPDAEAAFFQKQAVLFHIDKPAFYCGISADCLPDTLYKVYPPWRKEKMVDLALRCGDWAPVAVYENWLAARIRDIESLPDSVYDRTAVNSIIAGLKTEREVVGCDSLLDQLVGQLGNTPVAGPLKAGKSLLPSLEPTGGWGLPKFRWYGVDNQYNDWLLGRYAHEQYSPWKKIMYPLRVTLFINVLAILFSLVVGVFAGVMISGRQPRVEKIGKRALVVIYVAPVVIVGCMLRYLFATKGAGFYTAAIGGVGTTVYNPEIQGFWSWAGQNFGRLILPILSLGIHFVALIALQMRTGMAGVLSLDFIRTARAKGLSDNEIRWGHAFKNSLFPVITIIGALLPFAVGGAVFVEAIFNINGLGHVVLDAFLQDDYGVLMSVVMLSAVLTVTGSLVADMLFAWIDPRVKLGG